MAQSIPPKLRFTLNPDECEYLILVGDYATAYTADPKNRAWQPLVRFTKTTKVSHPVRLIAYYMLGWIKSDRIAPDLRKYAEHWVYTSDRQNAIAREFFKD